MLVVRRVRCTHADAISASEEKIPIVPIQQMMKVYTSPAGPPFVKPKVKTLIQSVIIALKRLPITEDCRGKIYENSPSHVAIRVHVNPIIEKKPNCRYYTFSRGQISNTRRANMLTFSCGRFPNIARSMLS